jgi:hypothetical protein
MFFLYSELLRRNKPHDYERRLQYLLRYHDYSSSHAGFHPVTATSEAKVHSLWGFRFGYFYGKS